MRRGLVWILAMGAAAGLLAGCGTQESSKDNQQTEEQQNSVSEKENVIKLPEGVTDIQLSDAGITVDGNVISTDENSAVYTANDIVFYLADQGFAYGEGEKEDEHTQEEADAHTVVYITEPGSYAVSGSLSAGQIAVDLGEEAEEDPEAVVTLYLNGVDITCEVAPAVIFYNVYECGEKDVETAAKDVDTSAAGANVVIVDDTVNTVNGSYVARIYKSYTLNEAGTEVVDNKKLHKYDGAFYSKMSLNMDGGEKGNGILNINAENEGLDSELHLTINGGIININSGNDGINTNEDNVSVTTMNGGSLNIVVNGSTGEGDGIDSNGWLVINGGILTSAACGTSMDAGIDSDKGIYINGGTVLASGNMLDGIAGNEQPYTVFMSRKAWEGGIAYTVKDAEGKNVAEYTPENNFMYMIVSASDMTEEGSYTLWNGDVQVAEGMKGMNGMGGFGGPGMGGPGIEGFGGFGDFGGDFEGGRMPDDFEFPEGEFEIPEGGFGFPEREFEFPEGMEPGEIPAMPEGGFPEGMEPPQMPERMERPDSEKPGRKDV